MAFRRTYSTCEKRVMVNLDERGVERLAAIHDRLIRHYRFEAKPSLSLLLLVALKRLADEDEHFVHGLWQELKDEARPKARV